MIQELLLFHDSGILILKKTYIEERETENEDLVSGFLSVVFQYFSKNFGEIHSIKTGKNLILISKLDSIYITLIIKWIEQSGKLPINDNIYFLNQRLAEIAQNAMNKLMRTINFSSETEQIYSQVIKEKIEKIIEPFREEMKIIRNISNPDKIGSDFAKIYGNISQ